MLFPIDEYEARVAIARSELCPPIVFECLQLYLSLCSAGWVESWRNFGYVRIGKNHSHSIVPGGLLVTSYTTRFTPFTSLMMRVAVSPRNFISNW